MKDKTCDCLYSKHQHTNTYQYQSHIKRKLIQTFHTIIITSIDYWQLTIYHTFVAAKYRQLFLEMIESNRDLFLDFKEVHDKYITDEETFKKEFNEKGKQIVEIIRSYEMKLTANQNSGSYSKFSTGLADKFWSQVRTFLPRIDFVGVK